MYERLAAIAPAVAIAFFTGCSDSQQPAGPPSQQQTSDERKVVEIFEVGKGVFVRALEMDSRHNALWVGTSVGVHEVDLETRDVRQTITREDGLANEYVFTILADSRGDQWFGTNGGGASRLHEGQWKTYFPMHGLADYWVYDFAEQSDGTLWIGTWYGVTRLDRDSGEMTNYLDELVNEWVYAVEVDSRQRVWFGTEGGISMYDGERWQAWTHEDGLGAANDAGLPPSTNTGLGTRDRHNLSVLRQGKPTYNPNYVFSLYITEDDTVWAGTWGGGVSRFDGEQWTNYTRDDGLAGNIVFSVTRDRDGVFWFGTNKGLSRFDGEQWETFDQSDGLLDDNVFTVAAAADGDIWLGTRGGVIRLGREL